MSVQSESFDVAVVGGGAIGLACAWRATQRGARVVVIDPGTRAHPPAWQVAAGMLAPVSEAEFGERALLELGLESAKRYAAFCAELEQPGYSTAGTLVVARDRDEAEALDRLAAFRTDLGLPVERLRPSQARKVEPALAPTIRLALRIDGDHAIDPRLLVAALARVFTGTRRHRARHGPARRGREGHRRAARRTARPSPPSQVVVAAGRRRRAARACPSTRACRCARSRARSCGCATRAAPASWSARSAASTRTSSRAATATTCSARRWRSAAGTRRRPRAASTSSCAT